jgi:hypothetical protein
MCLSISRLSRKPASTASMRGRLSNTRKSRTKEKYLQDISSFKLVDSHIQRRCDHADDKIRAENKQAGADLQHLEKLGRLKRVAIGNKAVSRALLALVTPGACHAFIAALKSGPLVQPAASLLVTSARGPRAP